MTYLSWEPRYRVTTISPGKLDLFVVTLIDGRRAYIDPVTNYDVALARADLFLEEHRSQIKVLPMTGPEVRNLLGIKLPNHPEPMDADVRQQIVRTLTQVVRESSDPDARADAIALLADMGVLQS
ncbi:MAG TPA: hypothetical protein VE989_00010 [Sphingomicrobium sp.]|jgi:hypothetical protein|nr:hypothetical protein [Sphingomicrobium sp.]